MRKSWMLKKFFLINIVMLSLFVLMPKGQAQVVAEIVGAGQNELSIVMAEPSGSSGNAVKLTEYINKNLDILPFVKIINPAGIPGGARVGSGTAQEVDFKRFLMAGADMLITVNWVSDGQVEVRTFEVAQGKFMFGNRYSVAGGENPIYDVADKFCGDLLEAVIGKGDFFRSTMAFSKADGPRKSDIWSVKPNGRHLKRLSNIKGEALSPTWSLDGRYVLFTHIDHRSHALGVWDAMTNSVRRVRFPGNTVIGPSYTPDNKIAVSLTDGRNPSIFLLNHAFQKERKIESSYAIDVSPSIDASGTKMAFTSSRLGGPQVFLKDLRSGSVTRISKTGGYNTDPSISPDGTLVAFARMVGSGQHRIFVHDLVTGQERQVSFGPGSDEEPSFAPDSFFIAFMSTRGGSKQVYLTTRNGGKAKRINTGSGDAAFPAWGAAR